MSVLCIGQSGYDIIFSIPGRLPENIKLRITDKLELPGGPATCAAALTGKWGLPTYLASRVGDDIFADAILEKLRQFQVNTDYVQKIPGANSSMSLVIRHRDNACKSAVICEQKRCFSFFSKGIRPGRSRFVSQSPG